ncbi:cyclophane-forming radical SAM/SPASM peptide maturase GrrM/OscB [Acidiplasma sp.]|uniref:cyclophane-forming radical SAM/SPASM peptide maturase GrrM/OscB n=1 Tax=Acidiplasma sp. TaxID=1872114 RepID=UPI00258CEF5B|nr:cyclophane-forming radical SAM/SPASM peptide maturase GrrM/OscB [Acidiplasma sp.]
MGKDMGDYIKHSDYYPTFVILQPTSFCNISCEYCYLPQTERNKRKIMDEKILIATAKLVLSSKNLGDHISFVWHAGEPLTLPIEFYEKSFEIIKSLNKFNLKIYHRIQTNGTLINSSWINLFKKWDISVGISIDPPKFVHDKYRTDRGGNGTFDKVVKSIELLNKENYPFHVITTLTPEALNYPEEIWKFYEENDIKNVSLNPVSIDGFNKTISLSSSVAYNKFRLFIYKLLKLREQSRKQIFFRWEDMERLIIENGSQTIRDASQPLKIITIDSEGNISTFTPDLATEYHDKYNNFIFGNILNINSLEIIFDNPKFKEIKKDIDTGITMCKNTCDYFSVCGGGDPAIKLWENKTFASTETSECRLSIKARTDGLLDYLETLPLK